MPRFECVIPQLTNSPLFALPRGKVEAAQVLTGENQWYRYAQSYKDAADHLAELAVQRPRQYAGAWTPILFLYRHYIELQLKALLQGAGELLDDPQKVPMQHLLGTLWARVRTLLLRIEGKPNDPWLLRAEEIVLAFNDVDPTSYTFRYPVTTENQPSLSAEFLFEASHVRSVVAELDVWLDGAATQIDVYMGAKPTMESDWR